MTDVVIDTDILSTFIKIKKLDMLDKIFAKSRILLTPAVYRELKKGQKQGMIILLLPQRSLRAKLDHAEKRTSREIRKRKRLGLC